MVLPLADAGYANTAGTGACADLALRETARFEREWTKASVKMDCNAWEGTVAPK